MENQFGYGKINNMDKRKPHSLHHFAPEGFDAEEELIKFLQTELNELKEDQPSKDISDKTFKEQIKEINKIIINKTRKMEKNSENTNMVIDTIIERQDEEQKKKNYKLLIIGHMRHGKDTVAEMIEEFTGMSFKSSSEMAAEIFIYDELKEKYGYTSFIECYEDRMNHRAEWHNLICDYNIPDKAKLAKEILKLNDMYVGMRSQYEIQKCIDDNVFDMIIGVYDERKPLEPKDSFDIDLWKSSDIVIPNNSSLDDLKSKVEKICKYLLN